MRKRVRRPSDSAAASRVARNEQVIEISKTSDRSPRFRLRARRISEIYHAGEAAANNRKPVIAARVPAPHWPSFGHFPYNGTTSGSIPRPNMSALANRPFVKMNGLGNEIVVVDMRRRPPRSARTTRARSRSRAARPSTSSWRFIRRAPPGTDSLVRIYNSDGSEAGACGNGMRCVASLMAKESGKDRLTFEVDGRVLDTWKNADGLFTVDMGVPRFAWNEIPLAEEFRDTRAHRIADRPDRQADPAFAVGGEHGQSARDLLGRRRERLRSRQDRADAGKSSDLSASAPTSRSARCSRRSTSSSAPGSAARA